MKSLEKLIEDKKREDARREELEAAWDGWLSTMNPSHIGVFSSSPARSPEEMLVEFRTWLVKVDSRHRGKTPAVASVERCPSTDRLHIQFLLFGAPEISPSWLQKKWTYGNRNRVQIYDRDIGYGTVYTIKDTLFCNEAFSYIRLTTPGAAL